MRRLLHGANVESTPGHIAAHLGKDFNVVVLLTVT